MKKRIVCTVTTDLNYDQRMIRICTSLANHGYDVTLIGRKRPHSKPFASRPYKQIHLNGIFESGFLFYAEYNIRLFFYLLKNTFDIYNACDLDTILPCTLVSKRNLTPLTYDAHEYFTEQEEIVHRPFVKWFWKRIERYCVPKVNAAYTVSKGYAKLFQDEYNTPFELVRNVTRLADRPNQPKSNQIDSYILYQGAVNEGRGLIELVLAMKLLPNKQLKICGLGDIHSELGELVKQEKLTDQVEFEGYVQPEELKTFTANAAIGITLFADGGLSHKHSLANRFFDYMHAGIPQLAMKYPEYQKFNENFEVAHLIPSIKPEEIAKGIRSLLNHNDYYSNLSENAQRARLKHNFSEDEKRLFTIYDAL